MMDRLNDMMNRFDIRKMLLGFFSVVLASLAIRSMVTAGAAIQRLLVSEGLIAILIVALFIFFNKPRKPSNPQHPLPSQEPPHLMRRVKSKKIV